MLKKDIENTHDNPRNQAYDETIKNLEFRHMKKITSQYSSIFCVMLRRQNPSIAHYRRNLPPCLTQNILESLTCSFFHMP
jgi:hypothetical protein